MTHPHHHQHLRKRFHLKRQPFPHPKKIKRTLDSMILWLGFLNVLATLPQVLEIYVGRDASGVSTLSWGYYTFFSMMLLIYGLVHKEIPIVATYLGSVAMYAMIFVGSIMY